MKAKGNKREQTGLSRMAVSIVVLVLCWRCPDEQKEKHAQVNLWRGGGGGVYVVRVTKNLEQMT